ncbi:hypothetical protein [Xanthocytophaga agilis]|uniref:Helix-turn-helix domain-containing protein n=1 Tax=Xanthocytophaga agilis TaxID=3048010 RepID=A0AAE3R7B0_9BACT|nr:hypothetical protein [Xanthocytophaga agilis]MDJ1502057.1 hypothetical protein [Xanthocytophaga agilis]
MNYAIVYYPLLRQFDITMPEYALIFAIDGLSAQTGWCYASRAELADCICVKQRWVYESLNRLIQKGLIEVDPQSRFLRASKSWKKAIASCKTQSATSDHLSAQNTAAQNTDDMRKMQRRKAQRKHRQAMHEVQSTYAETGKEPMQNLHSSVYSGLQDSQSEHVNFVVSGMHDSQLDYAPSADNNNIYSNINTNTIVIKQKSAYAQDFQFSNEQEIFKKEKAGEKQENFLKSEEDNQPVVEAAIVTPPQVAPAPSPKKAVQTENAMQNVHSLKTDSKATPVDPCLVPCREAYLLYFGAYKWVYGRDDKFLKQVLEQIRYKIAVQWQQSDRNLADIPDESVIHSFQSLLEMIPTWYRDNGHTTPNDLNRFFEKYYSAIKSGNGGGDRGPFAPLQDQEYETVQLLLQSRGRHNR